VPNPFPGMDPYLEGDLWRSVHADLISEIARQLAPQVRPKYLVLSERRFVVAPPDALEIIPARLPDVAVLESRPEAEAGGGTAVATAPLILTAALSEPIPVRSLEIRDREERRLVTAIELLSLTNKRGPGHDEYARKRQEFLDGSAHLVEIDLLRVGARFPVIETLPDAPYFVFLSRAGQRHRIETWPVALTQPLPTIPIPLLPGDPDVSLDVQRALTTVYDILGYDEAVDYSLPPSGPLSPQDAAWVEERLRQARRRP